jgi:cytochrome P450
MCAGRFGDAFTVKLPRFGSFVYVSAPELLKQIFTAPADQLCAGKANQILEPLVGQSSVLLLDGAEHLRQRRLLLPPFHGERMQAYARLMQEITLASMERWPVGEPFALHTQMQSITLDLILRAVFGLDEGAQMRAFAARLVDLFKPRPFLFAFLPDWMREIPGSPYQKFMQQRAEIDRELYALIDERRRAGDAAKRTDILSLLLMARDEDGQPMSDDELRDELMTMIAAGHETTATALSWAFAHILGTPAVQGRLADELRSPLSDPAELAKLPYLDATVKETLRLRPIVPIVVRRVERELSLGAWRLPAGSYAVPCIWLTQHRADLYPDPDRFQPERFVGVKTDPYQWLPFGGGARRCIGMAFAQFEMTVVLATVLSRARLRLDGPPVEVVRRSITFAPSGGTRVVREN